MCRTGLLPYGQAVTTIQGQITSCASSISQAAGLAALAVTDGEMQLSFDVMRRKVNSRPHRVMENRWNPFFAPVFCPIRVVAGGRFLDMQRFDVICVGVGKHRVSV